MRLDSTLKEVINVFLLILVLVPSTLLTSLSLNAQSDQDSLLNTSNLLKNDSLVSDSLKNDSLKPEKSELDAIVEYHCLDSMIFDVKHQKLYLYDSAQVTYSSMDLKANYIEIDLRLSELYAEGLADSTGKTQGKPQFDDGGQKFDSKTMRYNFKTKKGKITEAITQEGDGYIHGKQVKKMGDDVLYIKNGKYTTCSDPNPHFHIEASKLKFIKDNKIITGPAYLKVEDIPTPLAIPFGFFPNKKGQSSGIIFPGYGQSPTLGFFLTKGGYYFGINDHLDLALSGDIYSRGSWGLDATTRYKWRYKFDGNLNLSYSEIRTSDPEFPDYSKSTNFFVKWKHSQDPKARPNSRFSADVSAGSSNNFRNNINTSSQDYLTNTFQSNVAWNKTFPGKPFALSVNAGHSQSTSDTSVTIKFPQTAFTMSRIYPLKRKARVGKERWYEKIGLSYTNSMVNQVTAHEDYIFNSDTINRYMRNGMKHVIPLSTSFKVAKYFTVNPTANYSEKWYLETVEKNWNQTSQQVDVDTLDGFSRFGEANVSASLSTKFYGMYEFRSEKIKAIRHVVTPSVSFSLRPDYSLPKYGYYKTFTVTDSLGDSTGTTQYSIFDNGIYAKPGINKSGLFGFNLINNLEMKVRAKKDTVNEFKKVKIFETFNFNSAYNIFADSLNWTPVKISARTTLAKLLKFQFGATLDPYALDVTTGTRVNKAQVKKTLDKFNYFELARLTNASITMGVTLKSKNSSNEPKKSDKATEEEVEAINANPDAYIDFNVPWSVNVNYSLNYKKPLYEATVTNSINFSGDLSLTENWKIGFSSGYDFQNKDLTYTSIDVYRDLHCWELDLNVIPFGERQSFVVNLKVKSAVLQDLKLTRKRNWYDYQ